MAPYATTDFPAVCEDLRAHRPPESAFTYLKHELKSMRPAWARALVKSTLKAVRTKGLFEVWDDNISSAYTAHAHSMRQNMRKLCRDYLLSDDVQDQRKVGQVVAVMVSLYAGGLQVSDTWMAGSNKKLHRTLFIGAYNFVLNAVNALNKQQNDWNSTVSMHSLAAEEWGDDTAFSAYDSDAESKPIVPLGTNQQQTHLFNQGTVAGFIATKKAAASATVPSSGAVGVLVKSEPAEQAGCSSSSIREGRFNHRTFTKDRYFTLLHPSVRKADDDTACQHLKLTAGDISTAVHETCLDVLGSMDKMHVTLVDDNPDLLIFKNEEEKYYTLLTSDEAECMSAWNSPESREGIAGSSNSNSSRGTTKLNHVERLLSTVTPIAKAGGHVMILLVFNWRNIHQVLLEITVANDTTGTELKRERVQAGVKVFDSLPKQHDSFEVESLREDLQRSITVWQDWLDNKRIDLNLTLLEDWYQALGQQSCADWRCGYFMAMNARYLLEGKEPPRDCEGALDAAVIDLYASLVKHTVVRHTSV